MQREMKYYAYDDSGTFPTAYAKSVSTDKGTRYFVLFDQNRLVNPWDKSSQFRLNKCKYTSVNESTFEYYTKLLRTGVQSWFRRAERSLVEGR